MAASTSWCPSHIWPPPHHQPRSHPHPHPRRPCLERRLDMPSGHIADDYESPCAPHGGDLLPCPGRPARHEATSRCAWTERAWTVATHANSHQSAPKRAILKLLHRVIREGTFEGKSPCVATSAEPRLVVANSQMSVLLYIYCAHKSQEGILEKFCLACSSRCPCPPELPHRTPHHRPLRFFPQRAKLPALRLLQAPLSSG